MNGTAPRTHGDSASSDINALRALKPLDGPTYDSYRSLTAEWQEDPEGTAHAPSHSDRLDSDCQRAQGTVWTARTGTVGDLLSLNTCECLTLDSTSGQSGVKAARNTHLLVSAHNDAAYISRAVTADECHKAWAQGHILLGMLYDEALCDTAFGASLCETLEQAWVTYTQTISNPAQEKRRREECANWLLRWHWQSPLQQLLPLLPGGSDWADDSENGSILRAAARACDGTYQWRDSLTTLATKSVPHRYPGYVREWLAKQPHGRNKPQGSTEQLADTWVAAISQLAHETVIWWQEARPELLESKQTILVADFQRDLPHQWDVYRAKRTSILLTAPYCVGLRLETEANLAGVVLDSPLSPQELDICETLLRDSLEGPASQLSLAALVAAARELA